MIELDIEKRWEQGIDHHKHSIEVANLIRKSDTDRLFEFGGDGDNGEDMLYYLDIYFEQEDVRMKKVIDDAVDSFFFEQFGITL